MKKHIAIALFATLAGVPAFAADTSTKASASNPEIATPSWRQTSANESSADHGMAGPHGYGLSGEYSVDMMMESNIRMLGTLALSKEQKSKINSLSDEFKHNIWFLQGLINDESAKLSYLYEADRRDPVAIGKEYMKVFDLKRQIIETYLDTQNRIEDVLTPEQREKMKDSHHEMDRKYGHPLK